MAGKMSFAQRMMAKMGHKEGEGLGKTGEGRVNPIEVTRRPTGAGLGAVKEMSKEERANQRREKQKRGEEVELSSDEEERQRKRRKKENNTSRSATASGANTPRVSRPKTKFQTAAEFEAVTEGLVVPNVLKSLIDATGKSSRLLTSTSGLMVQSRSETVDSADARLTAIAQRARTELEAFAEAWTHVKEQSQSLNLQEGHYIEALDDQQDTIDELDDLIAAVERLQTMSDDTTDKISLMSTFEKTVSQLEHIQRRYASRIVELRLQDTAVAALHPLFKVLMADWEPLQNPTFLTSFLMSIRSLLGIDRDSLARSQPDFFTGERSVQPHKATTTYETMIYTLFLPRVRHSFTNDWNVYDPQPALDLVHAWRPLLPDFVLHNILVQLILKRLSLALHEWRPRRMHSSSPETLPHLWLFPWLGEFDRLDTQHTDASASHGLLADVRRKMSKAIESWRIEDGIPPGLEAWKTVLKTELDRSLTHRVLPNLSHYFREHFTIDPSDQIMTGLEHILVWRAAFWNPETRDKVFGKLLVDLFFPRWIETLFQWLQSPEGNFSEIIEWYTWWQEQLPLDVNERAEIQHCWDAGQNLMDEAVDVAEVGGELSMPSLSKAPSSKPKEKKRHVKHAEQDTAAQNSTPPTSTAAGPEDATFRDVLDAWCAEVDLSLLALHEAHPRTGLPLFRITASPSGKGGVVVYMQGDMLWVRNKTDRSVFEAMGLDEALIARAEGR